MCDIYATSYFIIVGFICVFRPEKPIFPIGAVWTSTVYDYERKHCKPVSGA